ncbi:MAG TPA: fructosamine kinase family protein [Steroidobacteraceae bacterium]|nr:fructosamine kinase family protein [Steroidobacteraceae bacterium]
MSDTNAFAAVGAQLAATLHTRVASQPERRVHGGCINESYRWQSAAGALFVKIASARQLEMFEAEAEGLEELAKACAVRVPRALAAGATDECAFLALEWIDFGGSTSAASKCLGEQLARQHRTSAAHFGWHRDNTIGSTPQINTRTSSWVTFFREHRLRYQLDLAARNGYRGRLQEQGAALIERLDDFFADHEPQPALLHGDLWGGNFGVDKEGAPVIFDPAVYYGDREADLAMMRLFGGFGASFYAAYEASWPLPRGAQRRVALYNLYHVLNHLNLFGGGYLSQAESMMAQLLR